MSMARDGQLLVKIFGGNLEMVKGVEYRKIKKGVGNWKLLLLFRRCSSYNLRFTSSA